MPIANSSPSASGFALALALLLPSACDSARETAADGAPSIADAEQPRSADPAYAGDAGKPSAGTGDARAPSPSAGDAGGPGETASLRARVCGTRSDWPAPLPAVSARTAARVQGARFGFVEGPVWIAERGQLLFSDMDFAGGNTQGPPARIRRLTPPSAFDVFVASSGSNGLALLPDGTLLAATHDTRSLSAFDLQRGTRTDFTVRYQGKRFSSPNDLTVRSDGMIYFTDPAWQLGSRTAELPKTAVYRVAGPLRAGTTHEAQLIDDSLDKPNGVVLSPDERTLYVGSSGSEVWQYDVQTDGSVRNKRMFAQTGASDGMTIDCAGNLYVASKTIEVFAPSGTKLGEVPSAEEPTNVAFGGSDRQTLYITAQTGIYALRLSVPGFPY